MSKRTVEVVPRSYQPTKAELDAPLKVNASPKQAAKALTRSVEVRERQHRRR